MGDRQLGWTPPPDDATLARAVAASSCFPRSISPLPAPLDPSLLTGGAAPPGPARDAAIRHLALADGASHAHLGLDPVWKSHTTVLVSEAGAYPKARREEAASPAPGPVPHRRRQRGSGDPPAPPRLGLRRRPDLRHLLEHLQRPLELSHPVRLLEGPRPRRPLHHARRPRPGDRRRGRRPPQPRLPHRRRRPPHPHVPAPPPNRSPPPAPRPGLVARGPGHRETGEGRVRRKREAGAGGGRSTHDFDAVPSSRSWRRSLSRRSPRRPHSPARPFTSRARPSSTPRDGSPRSSARSRSPSAPTAPASSGAPRTAPAAPAAGTSGKAGRRRTGGARPRPSPSTRRRTTSTPSSRPTAAASTSSAIVPAAREGTTSTPPPSIPRRASTATHRTSVRA